MDLRNSRNSKDEEGKQRGLRFFYLRLWVPPVDHTVDVVVGVSSCGDKIFSVLSF